MPLVIFACVHNAGRSQMAAAFFNRMATKARAVSAGTQPADRVHPEVLDAMWDVGVDLSDAKPRRLTPELVAGCDYLVTMGCGEECPVAPPSVVRLDWPLPDPKGQGADAVRAIREAVRAQVEALVAEKGWG